MLRAALEQHGIVADNQVLLFESLKRVLELVREVPR
jgi:hypothetical protein